VNVLLAPDDRLSHEASRIFVDLVFGGGLFLCTLAAALLAFFAWSRARRLSAEVWHRHGLRAGPILLTGTVAPVEDGPPGTPFIEVTITQQGKQYRGKNGPYIVWREVGRTLTERPFMMHTDGGDKVYVVPGGRVDLVDRLEGAQSIGPSMRTRSARIIEGEKIWLRGELRQEGSEAAGPYRGGTSSAWTMRPPAGGALFVSSEPVDVDRRKAARSHAIFALLFLVSLFLTQGIVFSEFRALRAHGAVTQGTIEARDRWRVRVKNGYHTHYAFAVSYDLPGEHYTAKRAETNSYAFTVYQNVAQVPLVYLPTNPTTLQLGSLDELGVSITAVLALSMALFFLLTIYLAVALARPWWRQKTVIDRISGTM
jgi:hypothetical protein